MTDHTKYQKQATQALIDYLTNKGYPRNSILQEVKLGESEYIADIVVLKDGNDIKSVDESKSICSIPASSALEVYEIKYQTGAKRPKQSDSRAKDILKNISRYTLTFLVYLDKKTH